MDLTDHLGENVVKYRWDAFGGMFAGALAPYSRTGITGKEYDQKTGLVFFGSRWYDPLAGRFTMPDSFMGRIGWPQTLNSYAYALNNPVRYLDPTGHDVGWGGGGGDPYDTGNSDWGSGGGGSGDSSGDSSSNNSDDSSNTTTSNDAGTNTSNDVGTNTSANTGNNNTGNTGTGNTTAGSDTTSGSGSGSSSGVGGGGGGGGGVGYTPPPPPPEGGDVQVQSVEPNTIGANQPVTGYTPTEDNTPQDVLPPDTNRPESYATFGQIANVALNATARVLEAYMDVSSLGTSAAARSSIRQLITSEAGWIRFGREAGKAADEVINTAEVAGKAVKYGPMNKGPLPDAVANTFRSGTYTQMVTQEEITLYRAYGGEAGEFGSYWTRTEPQGPLQAVIDSALDQNWGNTATNIATIKVPKGTTIYEGFAAEQRGLVGGGNQIYIEKVNPSWLVP